MWQATRFRPPSRQASCIPIGQPGAFHARGARKTRRVPHTSLPRTPRSPHPHTPSNMSGKGAKGLSGKGAKGTMAKGDKKKPVSRSLKAGLQFPVGRIHRFLKVSLRRAEGGTAGGLPVSRGSLSALGPDTDSPPHPVPRLRRRPRRRHRRGVQRCHPGCVHPGRTAWRRAGPCALTLRAGCLPPVQSTSPPRCLSWLATPPRT